MTSPPIAAAAAPRPPRSVASILLLIAAMASAVMIAAFARDPARAYHAYLTAYAFGISLVLGSIAFIMISHAANATWPVALRRVPEAVAAAMPALALLFVPVLFGLSALYPWARPEAYSAPVRELFEHRRAFMNPTFFGVRAGVYLAGWSVLAWLLRHWSLAMDRGADAPGCARKLRRLSYAGLPLATLTTGFSAYEWFMSLSVDFASTMFSAIWIAICLLAGVACTVVLLDLAQRRGGALRISSSHSYALGRLLFAFLFFFAYTVFFQYLLVWMANQPSEAAWYVDREHGPYRWIAWFLIIGEFALPFLALLSYRLKRNLRALAPIALWCLAALYVHINWLITPSSREPGLSWLDPVALLAVLGWTTGVASLLQRGEHLVPLSDPRYADALRYESR